MLLSSCRSPQSAQPSSAELRTLPLALQAAPMHVYIDEPPVCKPVCKISQAPSCKCFCLATTGEAGADEDPAEALDPESREAGGTRAAARLAAVHVVSAAEAAAGAFDIADVVLPLPGARIRYPEHDTAQARPKHVSCTTPGLAQHPPQHVLHRRAYWLPGSRTAWCKHMACSTYDVL
jgi:hypothetical protein